MIKDRPILLVEDNPDEEVLTIRALRKNNILGEIKVVHDGAEAIDYLNSTVDISAEFINPVPILIILDLKIPKINGLEVLKLIKAHPKLKFIPVVVLTSSAEEQDIYSSYSFGANSYIRKPVDYLKFVEVAGQIGIYWLMYNERMSII